MKMPKKMKKKWLKALRSGEYGQVKGKLTDGNGGFCCLGVLQHCVSGGKVEYSPADPVFGDAERFLEMPTQSWYKSVGIEVVNGDEQEDFLAVMNDGGTWCDPKTFEYKHVGRKKFSTIANWIEKNIETTD